MIYDFCGILIRSGSPKSPTYSLDFVVVFARRENAFAYLKYIVYCGVWIRFALVLLGLGGMGCIMTHTFLAIANHANLQMNRRLMQSDRDNRPRCGGETLSPNNCIHV